MYYVLWYDDLSRIIMYSSLQPATHWHILNVPSLKIDGRGVLQGYRVFFFCSSSLESDIGRCVGYTPPWSNQVLDREYQIRWRNMITMTAYYVVLPGFRSTPGCLGRSGLWSRSSYPSILQVASDFKSTSPHDSITRS